MKTLRIAPFLIACFSILQAQNIDYNKIILPERTADMTFEERLVQLAWRNHPSNKMTEQRVQSLRIQSKEADWSWLNDISAVGNLNEFTAKPYDPVENPRAQFFPRYNVGIRISLGTFILNPMKSRVANNNLMIGQLDVDRKKLEVRGEVLATLERFKEQYIVLKLRTRLAEDLLVMYQEAEKKFSAGQMTMDQYRNASQAYYIREETTILAKSQVNQRKLELEAMVGLRLEEIAGYEDYLKQADAEMSK